MATTNIETELGTSSCKVQIPTIEDKAETFIPRWSLTNISLPHAVVEPTSASDIIKAIKYATKQKLKVVPVGGGHGSSVPISSNTIYLSMSKFKDIDLNVDRGEVTIGGGCITGVVLKWLGEKGWYTCFPNSNAVGLVGALLGGLNHPFTGLHGLGMDNIMSINVIPFSMEDGSEPREITLSKEGSTDESSRRLFNALCGAGSGLGVVTHITLKAWPIADLGMTDNRVWSRLLMFPPPALVSVARAYLSIQSPPPQLSPVMLFMRAPPNAPKPGVPMILLSLNYFGPADEAEKACSKLLSEDLLKLTINSIAAPKELSALNDASEPMNRHGGYKDSHGAFLQSVDEEGIVSAFEKWLRYTEGNMASRSSSSVVVNSWNTECNLRGKASDGQDFFPVRERGIFLQASAWYTGEDEKSDADEFGSAALEGIRARDEREGRRAWGFVNNLLAGQDMREVYTEEQLDEIRSVKETWDRNDLGWSPVVNGWSS